MHGRVGRRTIAGASEAAARGRDAGERRGGSGGDAGGKTSDTGGPVLDRLAAQIPGLQLLGELGRGARSVVYRARRGDFVVALKLPSVGREDAAAMRLFRREAVTLARQHHPDLVVMDISMKELNGIEATAQIKAELPETRVLILSMHTTEDFVRRAIRAGASGYLVKDSAPLDLQMAIAAVMRNEIYLSPRISKHVVAGFLGGNGGPEASSLDALTSRQRNTPTKICSG